MTNDEANTGQRFTEKLRKLRAHAHPASRGPYTNLEIAAATGLSKTYIDNLFTGKQANPTRSVIAGLARFFCVKVEYFFDDDVTAQTDADLSRAVALAAALQNTNVERLALRASELDPEVVIAIIEMAERLPRMNDQANSHVAKRRATGES
jgi:transcriptional regulator with XRE-family HTH domain